MIFYGLFLYFVFTLVFIDIISFHDNILWFILLIIVFTFIISNCYIFICCILLEDVNRKAKKNIENHSSDSSEEDY